MFNKQTPGPAVDPAVDLRERVEVLEDLLRNRGELPPPVPLPKVLEPKSSFASRKREADIRNARSGPRVVSMGVSTEHLNTLRRGQPVPVDIQVETFLEIGHGARMWRREVGTNYMEPIRGGR